MITECSTGENALLIQNILKMDITKEKVIPICK